MGINILCYNIAAPYMYDILFCTCNYSNQAQNNDDRDRSRERDRNRRSDRPNRINSASHDRSRDRNDRGRKASERRIYVSNIPYDFRWQDLKDLFRTEVGKVAHVELFTDENDKPRGCGIVEFEDSDSVKIAVEKMHRYDIKGRKLVVKEVRNFLFARTALDIILIHLICIICIVL